MIVIDVCVFARKETCLLYACALCVWMCVCVWVCDEECNTMSSVSNHL